jgi:hypothetical protein
MKRDKVALLNLIAMGRITPREAERLLAVWDDPDETVLKLAVCLAVIWMALPHLHEFFTGIEQTVSVLVPGFWATAECALASFAGMWGGIA